MFSPVLLKKSGWLRFYIDCFQSDCSLAYRQLHYLMCRALVNVYIYYCTHTLQHIFILGANLSAQLVFFSLTDSLIYLGVLYCLFIISNSVSVNTQLVLQSLVPVSMNYEEQYNTSTVLTSSNLA